MDHLDQKNNGFRLVALIGFLLLVLLVYLGVLFDTQVVHYEEYLTQSIHSIAREETVDASRGIITDRSGRTLVSNSFAYDLTFDASLLKEGQEQNAAILRLVELCRKEGKEWIENLPVSDYAPFVYTLDSVSDTQRNRFLTYVKSLDEAADLLGSYLLEHPELAAPAEEAEDSAWEDSASTEEVPQTPSQQASDLLESMPASALSEAVLN